MVFSIPHSKHYDKTFVVFDIERQHIFNDKEVMF